MKYNVTHLNQTSNIYLHKFFFTSSATVELVAWLELAVASAIFSDSKSASSRYVPW